MSNTPPDPRAEAFLQAFRDLAASASNELRKEVADEISSTSDATLSEQDFKYLNAQGINNIRKVRIIFTVDGYLGMRGDAEIFYLKDINHTSSLPIKNATILGILESLEAVFRFKFTVEAVKNRFSNGEGESE